MILENTPPLIFPLCVFLWSPAGCFYSLLSKVDTFVRVSGQFRNQTGLENNSFAKTSRGTILWKQLQTKDFAMCYIAFYQNVPFFFFFCPCTGVLDFAREK